MPTPADLGSARSLFSLLTRLVGLLGTERRLALRLALANAGLAVVMLAEPVLFGRVIDALSAGEAAALWIAMWAGLGIAGAAAAVWIAYHADRLAHRRRLAALSDFFGHALALPLDFHAASHSGRLLRTMLAGADNLFGFWLSVLREHLAALLGLIALLPVASALDGRVAALLAVLAVIYTLAHVLVIRKTNAAQKAVERYHTEVAGRASDVVANVAVVQSFNRAQEELSAMRGLMAELIGAQTPVLRWWALLTVLTRTAATLTMVAVLALGAALHARGEITVGEIVSLVGLAGLLIGRLEQITGFAARLFFQLRPILDYLAVMDEPRGPPERTDASPLVISEGRVAFQAVSYAYPDSAEGAGVADLDFTAEPGQTIALVGATGSGKSTTLALLYRARDPSHGRVVIDGMDIRAATLASLRSQIAVVFQEAALFSRTIGENIAIGRPEASQAEIEAAARMAEAHDFILNKPLGYDTSVAERGANLSGGERQRIAMARAFLKNAPILILDEATAALDVATEARVQAALDRLRARRTTFIIAHRLSTVRNADQILVLDKGRIIERGDFNGLIAQGGAFARLAAAGGLVAARPAD